jgi:hypothetical protein
MQWQVGIAPVYREAGSRRQRVQGVPDEQVCATIEPEVAEVDPVDVHGR